MDPRTGEGASKGTSGTMGEIRTGRASEKSTAATQTPSAGSLCWPMQDNILAEDMLSTNSQVVDANNSIPLEWGARGGQGRRYDSANVADGRRLVMREGHVGSSYQL